MIHDRARSALIACEVALCVILLVGAGLLLRSAMATQRVDLGIDPSGVWTGRLTLPRANYPDLEQRTRTFEQIVDNLDDDGRVVSAAVLSIPPFTGLRGLGLFAPTDRPLERENFIMANLRIASPAFTDVLRLPLRGRAFDERDNAAAPQVVIINEAFARAAWPDGQAIGRRLYGPGGSPAEERVAREVVAVVGDIHEDGPHADRTPTVYYPLRQLPASLWEAEQGSFTLMARTDGDVAGLADVARGAAHAIDRELAFSDVRTLDERVAELLAVTRFNTGLLTALGVAGLALALIGIYGVVAYLVTQRTQELGIRMALGATPPRIVILLVGQGLTPVLTGVAAGTALALALSRLLESQLYGVTAHDPLTLIAVALAMMLTAAAAAVVPAWRCTRSDPRRALGM